MTLEPLPNHRLILSSLVTSIAESAHTSHGPLDGDNRQLPRGEPARELRSLMLTLHVLFPDLVLSALDLIDRRLVDRFQVVTDESEARDKGRGGNSGSSDQGVRQHSSPEVNETSALRHNAAPAYIVRPVPSISLRLATSEARGMPKSHVVQLAAWNCSCTKFAVDKYCSRILCNDSFDSIGTASPWAWGWPPEDVPPSSAFINSGSLPCCKHLLACLLAEKCKHLFGDAITDGMISKYEMVALMSSV